MQVIVAPQTWVRDNKVSIFLGGVIDQGKATPWGDYVASRFKDYNIVFLNPLRPVWDASMKQSIDNPEFVEQVEWELKCQYSADIRIYVFGINEEQATKAVAPITLLELGLFSDDETYVCCPKTYWRKGNVDITCKFMGVPVFEEIESLIDHLKERIEFIGNTRRTS
ncbi:MAG: nucleoside 2-deoxyribosyltransferase domain-containing protein [Janthinobacterium lividum]